MSDCDICKKFPPNTGLYSIRERPFVTLKMINLGSVWRSQMVIRDVCGSGQIRQLLHSQVTVKNPVTPAIEVMPKL